MMTRDQLESAVVKITSELHLSEPQIEVEQIGKWFHVLSVFGRETLALR